jgi:hypothetical protein
MADKRSKFNTYDTPKGGKIVVKQPDFGASDKEFVKQSDKISDKIGDVMKKGDAKFFPVTTKGK